MKQTVGIIGAGHLIRHMMPTLAKSGHRFVVSERGREVSAELARLFGVDVDPRNQAIADTSDIVILAVRPFDVVDVCRQIRFRPGQTVLSLCAGVPSQDLAPAVKPASLVMAMPVVAARFAESPTLLYPDDRHCAALLEYCGPVIVLDSEDQFAPASAIACYYGWVHELINEMTGWLHERGVSPPVARMLTAQMTRAAATAVRERGDASISDLVEELATPRSFTLKGLEILRGADAFAPWKDAATTLFEGD